MSGLYFTRNGMEEAVRAASALSFVPSATRTLVAARFLAVAVTRVDSPALWSPARCVRGLAALGGRLAFEERDWQRAESLPIEGGLACRLVLDAWTNSPTGLTDRLNGAACVALIDEATDTLHIWTDRMGVFPLYVAKTGALRISSHPDVLADVMQRAGERLTVDWVTVAEALSTAVSVPPYTYYDQIEQLDPATHYAWDLRVPNAQPHKSVFWQPQYLQRVPEGRLDVLAEELAAALSGAVKRRTNTRLGRTGVLLSGGADSRAAVFGARDPSSATCFTLFDHPNPELATAKRLARAAGAPHVGLQRSEDYYADVSEEAVRIAAGMWSIVDAHYLGVLDSIRAHAIGTILTGCYADYMFKGVAFNLRHRTLFGRNLPLFSIGPFDWSYHQRHMAIREPWGQRVRRRLEVRFPFDLRAGYPQTALAVEHLRLTPLSREENALSRLTLWRTLPWDPLLSDSEVLEVYGRLPSAHKVNGILWGKAVAKIVGRNGRRIPNNNYGTPVGASELNRALWFLYAVGKRKIQRLVGRDFKSEGAATVGSWPDWGYYTTHSRGIVRLWAEPSATERELFVDLIGRDPWSVSLNEWGQCDPLGFARILTLRLWLRQRRLTA